MGHKRTTPASSAHTGSLRVSHRDRAEQRLLGLGEGRASLWEGTEVVWEDEGVLGWMEVVDYCERTYCHWATHLNMSKMVNLMLCAFHHNCLGAVGNLVGKLETEGTIA